MDRASVSGAQTPELMCLTIIGIPLGLASFKLIPVSLTPFGETSWISTRRAASGTGFRSSSRPTHRNGVI
jgi:uncharacterized membrane protein YccF (DUF307 family)